MERICYCLLTIFIFTHFDILAMDPPSNSNSEDSNHGKMEKILLINPNDEVSESLIDQKNARRQDLLINYADRLTRNATTAPVIPKGPLRLMFLIGREIGRQDSPFKQNLPLLINYFTENKSIKLDNQTELKISTFITARENAIKWLEKKTYTLAKNQPKKSPSDTTNKLTEYKKALDLINNTKNPNALEAANAFFELIDHVIASTAPHDSPVIKNKSSKKNKHGHCVLF